VGRTCGTHGRGEKSVQGFGGKVQRKRPLRRLRHRWENGIRMDLWESGWGDMEWIHLAEDRDWCQALVNMMLTFGHRISCVCVYIYACMLQKIHSALQNHKIHYHVQKSVSLSIS
jgi:hypothetical protein